LVHNGILSDWGQLKSAKENDLTDTESFCQNYLEPLLKEYPDIWRNFYFQLALEDLIGYSKLIMLDSEGNVEIINQQKGEIEDEVWFSNSYFRTTRHFRKPCDGKIPFSQCDCKSQIEHQQKAGKVKSP